MDRQPVDLVRVEREEQYFDREEVLGRDLTSVFPTESRKPAIDGGALAVLLGAGNRKFISETELEEIKTTRGGEDDASAEANKPLMEVLREAKEAKESAFQDQWKQMKQGKNRPMDEDEMFFLDSIADQEAARRRQQLQEERNELDAFHAAQQQQQQQGHAAEGREVAGPEQQPGVAAGPAPRPQQPEAAARAGKQQAQQPKKQPMVAIRPLVRPIVKVKPQAQEAPGAGGGGGAEPATKRQRTAADGQQLEQKQQQQEQQQGGSGSDSGEGPGLAGLLGGYGSGSDSDS